MYQALYRKYRPQKFEEVVGQNVITKTLKNSIKNNTFTHAYMFFGPRGTGKTTISKIFARAVNCLEPVDGEPCGKCKNCLASAEKECVDIIEIDAASNNGVDEIRELKNKITLVPGELTYKVYIIDEVHMLSTGAFNALLKTLEEPPHHAIFILATTDPQKVPETVISRCQCFGFKRVANSDIVERLKYVSKKEKIKVSDDVLNDIAIYSDGGMRDALGLLDKLASFTDKNITEEDFAEINDTITKKELEFFTNVIFEKNVGEMLNHISKFNDSGKNLVQIITQLLVHLKNILTDYYTIGTNVNYPIDDIYRLANLINDQLFEIKKSSNPKIAVEMLLLNFYNKNMKKEEQIISREIISEEKEETKEKNKTNVRKENMDIINTNKAEVFKNRIMNIEDIMRARVNNIMCKADKNLLKKVTEDMKKLNDYAFDEKYGYLACSLLDSTIRAVSEEGIIISYEYDSVVRENLAIINKLTDTYNKITDSSYKLAIISHEQWEKKKDEYVKLYKEGKHYEIVPEPELEILEEIENDGIIKNDTVKLFGDLVEID